MLTHFVSVLVTGFWTGAIFNQYHIVSGYECSRAGLTPPLIYFDFLLHICSFGLRCGGNLTLHTCTNSVHFNAAKMYNVGFYLTYNNIPEWLIITDKIWVTKSYSATAVLLYSMLYNPFIDLLFREENIWHLFRESIRLYRFNIFFLAIVPKAYGSSFYNVMTYCVLVCTIIANWMFFLFFYYWSWKTILFKKV